MRHVWLVPLKKRQQRKPHGDEQQGHLDDAGQGLMVNPCVRQKHFAHMLNGKVIWSLSVLATIFSNIATINSLNARDFQAVINTGLRIRSIGLA